MSDALRTFRTRPRVRRAVMPWCIAAGLCLVGVQPWAVQPRGQDHVVAEELRVPMRDGARLVTFVWRPPGPGPFPLVLTRTPYVLGRESHAVAGGTYASQGYAYVLQFTRGRGGSDGQFRFMVDDVNDGYDAVEWLARQSWSNGRVAMIGGSYSASTAWLAARAAPPHLTCIVGHSPAARPFDELPYDGGAFLLQWAVKWTYGTYSTTEDQVRMTGMDLDAVYRHRPLLTIDEALNKPMPIWREFLSHPTADEYWKALLFTADDFRRMTVPSLTYTGWFDVDQPGALFMWNGMRKLSPARDAQYLVIGPWNHSSSMRGGRPGRRAGGSAADGAPPVGELKFAADSAVDNTVTEAAFLRHFLKGDPAPFGAPRARVYLPGTEVWRDLPDYPAAVDRSLYLRSDGRANTGAGDGRLDDRAPGPGAADHFVYEPAAPVPVREEDVGTDRRDDERRADVLVYTGPVLEQPVEVLGPVAVELHVASDAPDTDFTATLIDLQPDGRAISVGCRPAGIIRARFRNGYEREQPLTPGERTRVRIDLHDVGHVFLPGHRIRLDVSSSAYPLFSPNGNTGLPIATDTTAGRTARQTVFHETGAASRLILSVLQNTSGS